METVIRGMGIFASFLVLLIGVVACEGAGEVNSAPSTPATAEEGWGLGSHLYYGETYMDEKIAGSDVIVIARLQSANAAAERRSGHTGYFAVVEFTFKPLEYLKGSTTSTGNIVAFVDYPGIEYKSKADALAQANVLLQERNTTWDDRDAVLFLMSEYGTFPSTKQANRYWLGNVYSHASPYEDHYSIVSMINKDWLPEALGTGGSATSGGERYFLTDVPTESTSGGASGDVSQAVEQPSTALSALKSRITEIEAEITAGGGSDSYRECVYLKYEWEREVSHRKRQLGGVYHYIRHDYSIGSGLPAGTEFHTWHGSGLLLSEYGSTDPGNVGRVKLGGRDKDLFTSQWPAIVVTARPLPAGAYKFYQGWQQHPKIVCDAYPEDELKRREVFVTVTAPTGTVHEAFFDPTIIESAVGADASNGVLKPATFLLGDASSSIVGLGWEEGEVTLVLSPYVSLAGKTLDFIELDGAVGLSLGFDDGVSDGESGRVVWGVDEQPWESGDELMIRIR